MDKENDKEQSELPTNYIPTGGEVALAAKAAELGIKGGWKFIEWIKDEGPLVIQIIDSKNNDNSYIVEIRAINMAIHSIYLNSLELEFPKVSNVSITPKKKSTIGQHEMEKEETSSTLIQSGQSLDFIIKFNTPNKDDLKKGLLKNHFPMGIGKLSFIILNEELEKTKDIKFSIRIDP